MDQPTLTLGSTRLAAAPGGQAQLTLTVRNPGQLVESFRIDVVGLDATWWTVHPAELPVYPGAEESAIVVLSPPAQAQAPEGALPFGVRAVSTLDPNRSVVEEGDLEVGRVLDLQATIQPVTARARWRARYQLTYTNWGNTTMHLRLSVSDKDQQLGFRLEPEQIVVPVGGTAKAQVRVRPRKPFLRGQPAHRPFQVVAESGPPRLPGAPLSAPRTPAERVGVSEPDRPVVDAALQHLPVLSRAAVTGAALLAVLVAGLIALGLRTGGVKGATEADAAPEPPTGVTVTAPSDTLLRVRWQPSERALSYLVEQVDEGNGSVLNSTPVKVGVTAFDDKVDGAGTRRCYVVVAMRNAGRSLPTQPLCATSRDGLLPRPTDVQAVANPTGYDVTWTDDEKNSHQLLLDGTPAGAPSPPGIVKAALAVPAGQHCIQVMATRGEQQSSRPSLEACVVSDGRGTASATGTAGTGAATTPTTGQPTPTTGSTAAGAGTIVGWAAVFGPYQEPAQATIYQGKAQAAKLNAQVLSLPQPSVPLLAGLTTGQIVVVDHQADQAAAAAICDSVAAQQTPCRTLQGS